MSKEISRRSFLVGGASLGAIGAIGGLVACAPTGAQESETTDLERDSQNIDLPDGQKPWEVYPGDISESEITETVESDVVVIGLGASGSYAATSALENGLKVSVLERNETFNANGGSHFVFNSSVQKELGLEVDANLAIKDFLNISNNKVDARAVWRWANRSGEAADWLAKVVEPYGLYPVLQHSTNEPITNIYAGTIMFIGGENEPVDVVDNDPYNGDLGLKSVPEVDLLSTLLEHLESNGADVYFKHKSERLVKDERGRVVAVIASDSEGNYKKFVGKNGIVIASGSYDQDSDMQAYFCPTLANNPNGVNVPLFNSGDGSGIKQALWAGGTMQKNSDHPPMLFWGSTNCIKNVLVNNQGQRFIDETVGQSNMAAAQFNQPGGVIYAIWNEAYAEQLPAISYRADDDSWTVKPEQLKEKWDGLAEEGLFIKVDTLDEIAEAYGIPSDALNETIEQYNSYCIAGEDDDFHKNPTELHELTGPFYATEYANVASLASMGGLHVNADCQVLNEEEEPVEGLYAIGLSAGDFYANQYSTRFAGNSLGRCLSFGYLVGRHLAGLE